MEKRTVPETVAEDDDDVVVALETARVSEERDDLESAQKWLHRAAAAARRQGRPDRAGALSRSAARIIGQPQTFERQPDPQLVLTDFDDEVENTIVETAEEIARKSEAPLANEPSLDQEFQDVPSDVLASQVELPVFADIDSSEGEAPPPTDVDSSLLLDPLLSGASLLDQAEAHQALRVAVKKTHSGRFEARPLGPGEAAISGEQEALLLPLQGGSRF